MAELSRHTDRRGFRRVALKSELDLVSDKEFSDRQHSIGQTLEVSSCVLGPDS